MVREMDYNPNQIIRMMQLGMKQKVLESRAIWLCVGCFSCISQCPNRVNIPAMMDALREMALEQRVAIQEPDIWAFNREFLNQVKRHGRVFELGFIARYKLATKAFFRDMKAGMKMALKGRFRWFPRRVKRLREVRSIMEAGYASRG